MSISITIPLAQTPPSTTAAPRGDATPRGEGFDAALEHEEGTTSTSPTPMRTPRPETQAGQDTATSKEPSEGERDVREDAPNGTKSENHVDVASGAEAQSAATAWAPIVNENIPTPVVPNDGIVPDAPTTSARTTDDAATIPSHVNVTARAIASSTVSHTSGSNGVSATQITEPRVGTAPKGEVTSTSKEAVTAMEASVAATVGPTPRKPDATPAAPVASTDATTASAHPSATTHVVPPTTTKPIERRTEAARARSAAEAPVSVTAAGSGTEAATPAVTEPAAARAPRIEASETTPSKDDTAQDAESASPALPTATPSVTIGTRPTTLSATTANPLPERGTAPTVARADVTVETNVQPTPASRVTVDLATRRVEERLEASKGPGPGTFDKILESLRGELKTHADQITLRLDPAELGKVEVRLLARGDAVTVRVAADRDDVADLFRRDQTALHKVLAEAGVNVAHLDVRAGLDQGARHELWERASAAAVATPSYMKPKHTGSTPSRTLVRVEGRLDLLA